MLLRPIGFVRNVLAAFALVILLCGVFPVAYWLSLPLGVDGPLRAAEIIVVLGGGVDDAETMSPSTSRRLVTGIRLWRAGFAKTVVLTGGNPADLAVPESEVMARAARAIGVPADALVIERHGMNTAEQAAAVARIAKAAGTNRVIVVTAHSHMYRATRAFRRAGLEPIAAPTAPAPRRPRLIEWKPHRVLGRICALDPLLYEYGALAIYWWRGAI